jgi:hypothetical protein
VLTAAGKVELVRTIGDRGVRDFEIDFRVRLLNAVTLVFVDDG